MIKTVAVIGLLITTSSFAASFDCSMAGTSIENAICSNPELSNLDEQLASSYRAAVTISADKIKLKHEQRAWINQVRNKCDDIKCLALAYHDRINELTRSASNEFVISNKQVESNQPQFIQTEPEPPQKANTIESVTQHEPSNTESSDSEQAHPTIIQQQKIPEIQENAESPNKHEKASGITSLQLKLIGLALFVNAALTIYLHRDEKLIIYRDYTDAAITGAAPLFSIITYIILGFFETPPDVAQIISMTFFAILMLFVAKSTFRNNGFSVFFVMSLITKITIVGLYYAIMAALIFTSGSARRKGESYSAYEARKRREAQANAAAMAATTAGFVALSAWVCKQSRFTPIKEYFSLNATQSNP